jgi:predicted MFS family arabinose efflux permease
VTLAYLRPALTGAAATCTGIGLARFAYVPLFPAMVAAGWVDGGGAGLLGAANLLGYLLGALGAPLVARRLGVPRTLDLGMALAALSFSLCAWNGGLWWFAPWRLVSGMAGGLLMGQAGPAVLAVVPMARRGMAGGVVIAGVGAGVALGAVAVPALVPAGLPATWLGLALLVLLLWGFAHPRWPAPPTMPVAVAGQRPRAVALLLSYGLAGAGVVPVFVYLADLAVRGRGLGLGVGAAIWLLFGLGGIAGTLLGGRVADRLGGARAFRLWLVVQLVAMALTLAPSAGVLMLAAGLSGFAAMGLTAVTLALVRQLAGPRAGALWTGTTAAYAVAQALTAFALAALFAATAESHAAVFGAGLALSVAALLAALPIKGGPAMLRP